MSKEYKGILSGLKASLNRSRLGELLVIKGAITPIQLKTALTEQKKTDKPLGEIFLEHAMISRTQLTMILGRQMALRMIAASLFCFAAISTAESRRANADSIKDVPASIALASNTKISMPMSYATLFGSSEKQSSNLSAFTKWTSMFDRFDRALTSSRNRQLINEWQQNLSSLQGKPLKQMAAAVNTMMNEKPYISDNANWGKSDYWETPIEFIQRGGDCEDYAIAKYTALRMLGVPEERLRIAIVHDTVKDIPHAVLVVYTDEGTYALDNQNQSLVRADGAGRYRPIFSINRNAWWMHTKGEPTRVASAAR